MKKTISILLVIIMLVSVLVAPAMAAADDGFDEEIGQANGGGTDSEISDTEEGESEPVSTDDIHSEAEAFDAEDIPEDEAEQEDEPFVHHVSPIPLRTSGHSSYMSGYGDGIFAPGAGLTRAQTAQMLFNLLTGTCEITASFADVDSNFWCYKAIGTLASLGVIQGNNGYFRPDASVSRAEFLAMVSRFYEMPEPGEDAYAFSDVSKDHWAYRYIQNGTAKGWVNGYSNGTFAPDAPVSRAEAAVIINRVLGRNADRQLINANPNLCKFYDIAPSHWAYYEIMEATVSHVEQITFGGETWASYDDAGIELSTGFHYIENHLYYYDSEGGGFVRDGNVGRFDFNSDGRYTTGSEELDTYLYDVSCQIFKDSMSKEERLRAAYLYTRDSFTYLRRNYYDNGATGWETAEALTMFRTHHGNCYCYASVFYFLSRWIGYDSTIFAGQVGVNRSPHGWVEIMLDGTVYMFDAELEMARLRDHRPYYDLYKFTYSNAPWSYYK